MNSLQLKTDFLWTITLPLTFPGMESPQIPVKLKLCTLYNGVPNGPAVIHCSDEDDKETIFDGVGVFTDGKLHDGPCTFFLENRIGVSYSQMKNGKPADDGYVTLFWPQGEKEHVNSLTEKRDVSGWQMFSGQV